MKAVDTAVRVLWATTCRHLRLALVKLKRPVWTHVYAIVLRNSRANASRRETAAGLVNGRDDAFWTRIMFALDAIFVQVLLFVF